MWSLTKNYSSSSGWLLISVVTILLPLTAHGQAYRFIIGHHQHSYDQYYREPNSRNHLADTNYTTDTATIDLENSNSTIIVTTVRESNDLSQTAMDIITIVWYVATFLALAAFFLLMACSDRRCSDSQQNNANLNTSENPIPPPSPSPSYSKFAPPSYDSVMKMQHARRTSVFVIPFQDQNVAKDNSSTTNNDTSTNTPSIYGPTLSPNISFYTINELQKMGS